MAGAGEAGPEHRVGAQHRSEGAVEAVAGAGWRGADGQLEEETAAAQLGGVVSTESNISVLNTVLTLWLLALIEN